MNAFYFFPHTHYRRHYRRGFFLPQITRIFDKFRFAAPENEREDIASCLSYIMYYITVVLSCKIRTLLPSVCFLLRIWCTGLTVMSVHSMLCCGRAMHLRLSGLIGRSKVCGKVSEIFFWENRIVSMRGFFVICMYYNGHVCF